MLIDLYMKFREGSLNDFQVIRFLDSSYNYAVYHCMYKCIVLLNPF